MEEELVEVVNQLAGRDIAIVMGIGLIFVCLVLLLFGAVLYKMVIQNVKSNETQDKIAGAQTENALAVSKMAISVSRLSDVFNTKIDLDRQDRERQIDDTAKLRVKMDDLKTTVTDIRNEMGKHSEFTVATQELRDAAIELRRIAREFELRDTAHQNGIERMIAVIVPTIRLEKEYKQFLSAWDNLFKIHEVILITVIDGEHHRLQVTNYEDGQTDEYLAADYFEPEFLELITHKSPACRNLGIAWAMKYTKADYFLTLDDDVKPLGDTISSHLMALSQSYPTSWLSTTMAAPAWGQLKPTYMRGFPYGIRNESEAWVSHGIWRGVPDLDAPTQLVLGEEIVYLPYIGPIPKGIYAPICGMNIAWKREATKFMYWAPVATLPGAERFDDIWMGIYLIDELTKANKAVVTGFAEVKHERASNVFTNLKREQAGIVMNETVWQGKFTSTWFEAYEAMRKGWLTWIETWA